MEKYCGELAIYPAEKLEEEWTFAVQKGSHLRQIISYHLLKIREAGFVDDIVKKWLYFGNCSHHELTYKVFPWQYIGGWLVIFGGTIVCSILILITEHVYFYITHKYRSQYEIR